MTNLKNFIKRKFLVLLVIGPGFASTCGAEMINNSKRDRYCEVQPSCGTYTYDRLQSCRVLFNWTGKCVNGLISGSGTYQFKGVHPSSNQVWIGTVGITNAVKGKPIGLVALDGTVEWWERDDRGYRFWCGGERLFLPSPFEENQVRKWCVDAKAFLQENGAPVGYFRGPWTNGSADETTFGERLPKRRAP